MVTHLTFPKGLPAFLGHHHDSEACTLRILFEWVLEFMVAWEGAGIRLEEECVSILWRYQVLMG